MVWLAEACWGCLSKVNRTLDDFSCSQQEEPSPLVFSTPFQGPQPLDAWLAGHAGRLTATERVLYSPGSSSGSSPAAQDSAYQQLCQQLEELTDARQVLEDWQAGKGAMFAPSGQQAGSLGDQGPDVRMVVPLCSAWAGHVPWSLIYGPGLEQGTAKAVAEALMVSPEASGQ